MKTKVLKYSLVLIMVLSTQFVFGTNYTTIIDGAWSSSSTWRNDTQPTNPGVVGDTIFINNEVSIKGWVDIKNYIMIISSAGTINGNGQQTQNLSDNIRLFNYGMIHIQNLVLSSSTAELENYGEIIIGDKLEITNGSLTNNGAVNGVYYPYIEVKKMTIGWGGKLNNFHHIKVINEMQISASSGNVVNHSGAILYSRGKTSINSPGIKNDGDLYIDGKVSNINLSGIGSTCTSGGNDVSMSTQACTSGPIDIGFPIELLSFTAQKQSNNTRIIWTTASEENNDFFTIERSQDGEAWGAFAIILGAGNSNRILEYEVVDYEPIEGTTYYRLKQTDYDGAFSYSDVVVVYMDEKVLIPISVYPNPATGRIQITTNQSSINEIHIFNMLGQEFTAVVSISQNGDSQFTMDISSLPIGVYIIRTKDCFVKVYKQ